METAHPFPFDAAIAVECGEPAPRPPLASGTSGSVCAWFPIPAPGTVTAIDGADRVAGLPGVAVMEVDVEVGGTVPPLRPSRDRVAMVIVRAEDRDTLEQWLQTVQDELRLTVRPTGQAAQAVQQRAVRQRAVRQRAVGNGVPP